MWILLLTLGAILAALPYGLRVLRLQRERRLQATQLRQALQTLRQALQAGAGFLQAFERATAESADPLGQELKTVLYSVQTGRPLDESLIHLRERIGLPEMQWFTTAVIVTQQTGGSLGPVLDQLSNTLQEREAFREKLDALTAQGKASGLLLSLLPFVMLVVLWFIAPDLVTPLFTTEVGQLLLASVLISICIGGVVMFKIVSVDS
jgi:tight adherence protein B